MKLVIHTLLWASTLAFGASPSILTSNPVSLSINIQPYLNNKGVSVNPGGADFDGQGGSYALKQLPAGSSTLPYRGINFTLPNWSSSSADNILSQGQVIKVTAGRFQSLHLLGASDGSTIYTNNITVSYADGSEVSQPVLVPFWKTNRGPVNVDFTFTATGVDGNSSHIHYFQVPLNAGKVLSSITLPSGTVDSSRFHVFAMSLFTSSSLFTPGINSAEPMSSNPGPALTFQYVRSRNQWYNDSALPDSSVETTALSFMKVLESPTPNTIVQVIEVGINNLPQNFSSSSWLTSPHTVEITSPGLQTIYAGRLSRLRAGDQARVKGGVVNKPGTSRGATTQATAVVKDENGEVVAMSEAWEVEAGITVYDGTLATLQKHEAAKWFEDSKFGIFVHWGVYSVPAFAPSGQIKLRPPDPFNFLQNGIGGNSITQ
ncbi:glycoside hydrolase family 29 protein [Sphaerobolus stellatus SS14]|nr:glycoside hydrolase family 29 protein [Sphaerobolus stellatus SS14]